MFPLVTDCKEKVFLQKPRFGPSLTCYRLLAAPKHAAPAPSASAGGNPKETALRGARRRAQALWDRVFSLKSGFSPAPRQRAVPGSPAGVPCGGLAASTGGRQQPAPKPFCVGVKVALHGRAPWHSPDLGRSSRMGCGACAPGSVFGEVPAADLFRAPTTGTELTAHGGIPTPACMRRGAPHRQKFVVIWVVTDRAPSRVGWQRAPRAPRPGQELARLRAANAASAHLRGGERVGSSTTPRRAVC